MHRIHVHLDHLTRAFCLGNLTIYYSILAIKFKCQCVSSIHPTFKNWISLFDWRRCLLLLFVSCSFKHLIFQIICWSIQWPKISRTQRILRRKRKTLKWNGAKIILRLWYPLFGEDCIPRKCLWAAVAAGGRLTRVVRSTTVR